MRWDQVDWHNRTWRIPDTKNGEPVVIPLTDREYSVKDVSKRLGIGTKSLYDWKAIYHNDSGKRTYIITARRMNSGDVLKYRNGLLFFIQKYYGETPISSKLNFLWQNQQNRIFIHSEWEIRKKLKLSTQNYLNCTLCNAYWCNMIYVECNYVDRMCLMQLDCSQ